MEAFLPFLIFGGIVIVVVIIVIVFHRVEKKRTETITEIATELGLSFQSDGDEGLRSRFSGFTLMNLGRRRKLRNALVGETDEVRLALFDYQYTTGNNKQSHTHRQTVAAIESSSLVIPPFSMRPEGLFDFVGGLLGFQDIDFSDHPEFSKSFVLKSKEEEAVREYFDRPILDYFAERRGISVEATNGQMIFFRAGQRVKPEDLKQLLADAYEIYGLLVDRGQRQTSSEANDA